MKKSLEVNGEEAKFDGNRVRYINGGWLIPLPKRVGAIVTICAWCDSNKLITKKIELAGYNTSHGICENHLIK